MIVPPDTASLLLLLAQQMPNKWLSILSSLAVSPSARADTDLPLGVRGRILTSVEMVPHREEGHVEGHIPHGRVGLEDGDDGYLDEHEEDRVLPGAGQDRQTDRDQSGTRPTPETPDSIPQTQKYSAGNFRQVLALLLTRQWGQAK